ncbi:unnamed protein product (mitochondrion) [Plasmodiophora brassicae]|uniref:Nuclear pore complex protein Nup85 n=1 Tax=Plasmodiophora brassicae TaxID=37360 RepID=A0A3P3YEP4_PLABS|nr:unnamed protein product [Plasmodiophora brassicae]
MSAVDGCFLVVSRSPDQRVSESNVRKLTMSTPAACSFGSAVDVAVLPDGTDARMTVKSLQDYSPYTTLLQNWHQVFETVHIGLQECDPADRSAFIVDSSSRYIAELGSFRDAAGELDGQVRIAESIWLLSHVMFVLPYESISRQIVSWFHFHNAPTRQHPERGASLWKRVTSLTVQGYLTDAVKLISAEGATDFDTVAGELCKLLQAVPILDPKNVRMTAGRFDEAFRNFQQKCAYFSQLPDVASSPDLQLLAKVVSGDIDAIMMAADGNWLYGTIAVLVFASPFAAKNDLGDIVAACQSSSQNSLANTVPYEETLVNIMSNDASSGLASIRNQLGLPWLEAHLCDLLHVAGCHIRPAEDGVSLRQKFLFEFGSAVLADSKLWLLAPAYLVQCGNLGRETFRQGLWRHVDSEFAAEKAIDICQRLQMQDESSAICKMMSANALEHSRPGSAFLWELRANDVLTAARIVQDLVDQFIASDASPRISRGHLEEMIAACAEPPSSLLSLCAARSLLDQKDPANRLTYAASFLRRADYQNRQLDIFVAKKTAAILVDAPTLAVQAKLTRDDIGTLMRLLADAPDKNVDSVMLPARHALVTAMAHVCLRDRSKLVLPFA